MASHRPSWPTKETNGISIIKLLYERDKFIKFKTLHKISILVMGQVLKLNLGHNRSLVHLIKVSQGGG